MKSLLIRANIAFPARSRRFCAPAHRSFYATLTQRSTLERYVSKVSKKNSGRRKKKHEILRFNTIHAEISTRLYTSAQIVQKVRKILVTSQPLEIELLRLLTFWKSSIRDDTSTKNNSREQISSSRASQNIFHRRIRR